MDCPPTPQFCLDFLQRSETYSKERTSIPNRDFPQSSKPKHVVAPYIIAREEGLETRVYLPRNKLVTVT